MVLAVGGWLGYRLSDRLDSEARARKAAEAKVLASEGLNVAQQVTIKSLSEALGESNKLLKAAVERAKKAAPGTTVVSVSNLGTGPVVASGDPRPDDGDVLLRRGDKVDLRLGVAELRTEAGNDVLVATARAVRVWPAPETLIAEGEAKGPYLRADSPPGATSGWPTWALVVAAGAGVVAGTLVVGVLRR